MAKEVKNLPVDQRWNDPTPLGNMAKNHSFVDGEYLEAPYEHKEFPKTMYHPDYIADRKPNVEYTFTQSAQIVHSQDEVDELGPDWKSSPGELGIVTAPDAALQNKKRKEAASKSWRDAVMPDTHVIGEEHLKFLKNAGAPVENMADVYKLLAQMSKAQSDAFMAEVAEANAGETKPKKAAGKKEKANLVTA